MVSLTKVGNSFGRQSVKSVITAISWSPGTRRQTREQQKAKVGDQWKKKEKNSNLVYSRCSIIADDKKMNEIQFTQS